MEYIALVHFRVLWISPNNKKKPHNFDLDVKDTFENPLKSAECKFLKGRLRLTFLQAVVALETLHVHAVSLPRRGRGRCEREIGREEKRGAEKSRETNYATSTVTSKHFSLHIQCGITSMLTLRRLLYTASFTNT